MGDVARLIREVTVARGTLAIFWLGQAGFVFKRDNGQIIYLDPYLSDAAERLHGFKRLSPSVIEPSEVRADFIISTHSHVDHFDIDALPEIARASQAKIVTPPVCITKCIELGLEKARLIPLVLGRKIDLDGTTLIPVFADHGDLAPEAVGVVLDFRFVKVYFTSDTAYRPDRFSEVKTIRPEIIIPVINGAYGNLNGEEAAKLTRDVGARIAIPSHFWTFAEHNGNPEDFRRACREIAPRAKVVLITPGKYYLHNERKDES